MSQNLAFRSCFAASFLAVAAVVHVSEADPRPVDVVIRIYDGVRTDDDTRAAAIRTAAGIVAGTGVSVSWHDCTGDAERRHCDHLRDARNLIIRIVPTLVPGTIALRGSVEARARPDAAGFILGFAVVETPTGAGALATVFMDRVLAVAQRTAVPQSVLLGRAIAHEVGHLLLATNAHSRSGLMREIWTDAELALDRREDWLFAPSDRSTLRTYVEAGGVSRSAPP